MPVTHGTNIAAGIVTFDTSAIATSLAAAAHQDILVRPAVGHRATLQAAWFSVSGPAGAGSGTHNFDIILTDGTNEIPMFESDVVFGTGMSFYCDSSSDTGARPELLDRPLLNLLQNIVLTNDVYLILRYTNNTDVATTRARNCSICYRETGS